MGPDGLGAGVTGWLRAEVERLGFDAFLGIIPAARQPAQALGSIVVTTRVDRDGFAVVSRSPVF